MKMYLVSGSNSQCSAGKMYQVFKINDPNLRVSSIYTTCLLTVGHREPQTFLKTFLVPVAAMPQRNEKKEREKEQQQQATFLCDFCISFLSLFTCNRHSLTDIL